MSKRIPEEVAREIKDCVYLEADCINYLARSRTDNGRFLAQLVAMPNVGGRLAEYMSKAEIRTYIKDAILNRYSKDKTKAERPDNPEQVIFETFGIRAAIVEQDPTNLISLYKSTSERCFVVLTDGTVLKWETALRKALIYVASKPQINDPMGSVRLLLTLFARHQKVSPSDLRLLEKALMICNAKPYIYGEN